MTDVQEHNVKLLEVVSETPEVKLFRFEYPKGFDFQPGQFMMLYFIDEPDMTYGRAYSFASSPHRKEYIEIGLDKVARFTQKMFSLTGGETMKIKGPYGRFFFSDDMTQDMYLIGSGTGITPLMSIVRHVDAGGLSNNMKLLYSVKRPELIIYREEIEKLNSSQESFSSVITVTRPEESDAWSGRTGRIDKTLLDETVTNVEEGLFFLCGANEFVKAVIGMLTEMGVSKSQIKTDIWGE